MLLGGRRHHPIIHLDNRRACDGQTDRNAIANTAHSIAVCCKKLKNIFYGPWTVGLDLAPGYAHCIHVLAFLVQDSEDLSKFSGK